MLDPSLSRCNIERLPNELLELTLLDLDAVSIVNFRKVARRFRNLIDSSIEIQLRIELAIDGLVLQSKGGWDAFSLTSRIKATRDAFTALRPFHKASLTYPEFSKFAFEIQDGYWCRTRDATEEARFVELDYMNLDLQHILQQCEKSDAAELSDAIQFHPVFPDLGFWMCDLTFAPGCDLQLILEAPSNTSPFQRLHFRTISTNEPHPLATEPYIELESLDSSESHYFSILLFEDRVAIVRYRWQGRYRRGEVSVWDWKRGIRITKSLPDILDAAFLTRDVLLLILEIEEPRSVTLGVYSIPTSTISHTLCLPPLGFILMAEIYSHSNSSQSSDRDVLVPPIIRADTEMRILPVRFFVDVPTFTSFSIVLSISRILQALRQVPNGGGDSPSVVQWETWGPRCSRWFLPDELHPSSIRSTRGSRVTVWGCPSMLKPILDNSRIVDEGPLESRNTFQFVILDFNPRSFGGRVDYAKLENSEVVVMDAPSVWRDSSGAFSFEVQTELPFRAIIGTKPWSYDDIYLDAFTLICRTGGIYDIYSFLSDKTEPN